MNRIRPSLPTALLLGLSATTAAAAPVRASDPATTAAAASPAGAGEPAAAASPAPAPRLFALVVGSNDTLDPQQAPLQFADDDAARTAELLAELGADVELLTTLDRDSQATFAPLVGRTRAPTRDNLLAARDALARRIAAARAAGAATEVFLYYSGHGNVGPDGNEYLNIAGGKLGRDDLFGALLGGLPADYRHLVIDACRSEAFVLSRGGDWKPDAGDLEYAQAVQRHLAERTLDRFPTTGVTLATSADQQTHEWARYRGGVFTHELLSGLRGAADLNGDGAVEYSELGAFVSAANSGVRDPRARLRVVVLPPAADQRHPIVRDADIARRRVLLFSPFDDGRYTVEDARGVRLADLRRGLGQPSYLRLPPGEVFVYREGRDRRAAEEESRIPAEAAGVIDASAMAFHATERQSRGALDTAFRAGLFRVGYGPGYYAGYTDQTRMLASENPEWRVDVWRDGRRVSSTTFRDDPAEAPKAAADDDRGAAWRSRWGALSFGTPLRLFVPGERADGGARRLDVDEVAPWLGPVRGFELGWHSYDLAREETYPDSEVFLRTGYARGESTLASTSATSPAAVSYQSVPIFVGFNGYFFEDFALRPYAGAAVGLDLMYLHYSLDEQANRGSSATSLGAQFGFELHAGLDLRMTNYLAVQGELRQLWSDTRELAHAPDFSLDGLSGMLSVQVALPFDEAPRRSRRTLRVDVGVRDADGDADADADADDEPAPAPAPKPTPAPPPAPAPEPTPAPPPAPASEAAPASAPPGDAP